MTTAGFVSGTRDQATPTGWARSAAATSALLGATLVAVLPTLIDAAFYLGLLGSATALLAFSAACALWTQSTLVNRTMAAIAAGSTVVALLLQLSRGLPGVATELGRLTLLEIGSAMGLGVGVLALLLLDALLHRPEQRPDHPYAL
ncbi:MAG TPA: hypothetical protein VLB29_17035 [Nocardioidaceae bacterium]|nr:hypothetical protein [Nocardioidaceae bacterium]